MPRRMVRVTLAAVLLVVAGCSSPATEPTTGNLAITITDAWVRPPMATDRPAAGYLTISAPAGRSDALVGARTPIAASVEIHETTADASGMMAMHPVKRIPIPAGTTVRLEPGGYHLMLMDIASMPAVGETVHITLTFETAGDVDITAQVRAG